MSFLVFEYAIEYAPNDIILILKFGQGLPRIITAVPIVFETPLLLGNKLIQYITPLTKDFVISFEYFLYAKY